MDWREVVFVAGMAIALGAGVGLVSLLPRVGFSLDISMAIASTVAGLGAIFWFQFGKEYLDAGFPFPE